MEILRSIPQDMRIGIGVCNQKHTHVESVDEIVAKGKLASPLFGKERVLFTPDCGFATVADDPILSDKIAKAKFKEMAQTVVPLRERHGIH
jgi:5-methyltetrahydropteroyltriglutamate--homocysteine methyltransferase